VLRLEQLRQIVTVCAWTGQVKLRGRMDSPGGIPETAVRLSVSHGLSKEAAEKMIQEIRQATGPKANGRHRNNRRRLNRNQACVPSNLMVT
jgi:hypothetical protein